MWANKIKIPLSEHTYAFYPFITIITVVIISCRISAMSRSHKWHHIPSPWSTIVSFGENFSDSGNGAHVTGGKYPSEPWYWHHRFTNGPNWIDNLILDLGGLGSIRMRNFAHGGATTDNALLKGNLLGHLIPGTHQQVRGFMLKSRQSGYPKPESTLYTIWTGANDLLALGGAGSFKTDRKFNASDIEESIFQNILQLERDSHNKISNVLILTPPPVEDMPLVKNDKSATVRPAIRQITESLGRNLPHVLFEKFSTLGKTSMTDNVRLGPVHPSHQLPNHRVRTPFPITHYLTVDLPHDYNHLLPHEHNGTKAITPNVHGSPLFAHPELNTLDVPHRPTMKLHKRYAPPSKDIVQSANAHNNASNKLHIMIYDAHSFIKHAEEAPACFGLNPAMMSKTCEEQPRCYDRVWIDDTNISTGIHYWMARDINVRLHMWHMYNNNVNIEKVFKNVTRAKELELEMLGFTCPMHEAPTAF
ncbi:hypothetical protein GGI25_000034 [Coemansia spiralis]|uniref:Uncharacterized protein n=2 Tax=Coemansia TaxID=4863 RepID=A0A9W8G819_9FUNG|nr:hypothetical protein BX070DRAFT_218877 [Coemansia spiralis]KAJ1989858.1 hypothetical protein EDC05_004389 [Coemansia umbellata]KAJ2623088.1 hypothetical protein GGI26_002698 [Coemansia sp. RSA 1358]KAJ2681080.1 hypothetical protein GGI25_000034 [Coemansia spiralis]